MPPFAPHRSFFKSLSWPARVLRQAVLPPGDVHLAFSRVQWNPYMPKGAAPLNMTPPQPAAAAAPRGIPRKVVYVPACVTRIMG